MVQASDAHSLRTDTTTEAIRALEHSVKCLELGRNDAYQLKWAIHALQQSTQQFMFATFDFGDRRSLDGDWWAAWQRAFDSGNAYPDDEPKTNFLDVYKRFKKRNPSFASLASSVGVDFHRGRDVRNAFEHLSPKAWVIGAAQLRSSAGAFLRVIRFIVCERQDAYSRVYWPDDEDEADAIALLERGEMAVAPGGA